jgi:hypothetical protein
MAQIVGPPANVIRNRPITTELRELLDGAAEATGVARVVIVSGGQTSNHAPHLNGVVGGWTGSRRHDNGRAADIELVRAGDTLTFTDTDGSKVAEFVTAAAARGAIGIGAGVNYMGRKRIHVGFGNSPTDLQKLVWGAAGLSANAPAWLRAAAGEGWSNPVEEILAAALSVRTSGRSAGCGCARGRGSASIARDCSTREQRLRSWASTANGRASIWRVTAASMGMCLRHFSQLPSWPTPMTASRNRPGKRL